MWCTGVCCVRTWLITISVFYMLLGLLIAVFGGLLYWQREAFIWLWTKTTGEITLQQLHNVAYHSLEEFRSVSMGMFVIGLFIIGIYLLGVLAGATFNRNLIIIFSVLNGLLIIIHITIIIVYLVDSTLLTRQGKIMLEDSVQKYVSITSDDANSQRLAYLMRRLECCGVKNGEDFVNSTSFQRAVQWQGTAYTLMYPIPCCKFVFYNQPQGNCPSVFDPLNSSIAYGCWEALMKVAVGVLWGSIILLVLMVSLECVTISMLLMTKDW